jgi:hypothetical protein
MLENINYSLVTEDRSVIAWERGFGWEGLKGLQRTTVHFWG